MKRFAQQLKKQANKTKLTPEEQFLLREKIITFMEYHPLSVVDKPVSSVLSLEKSFIIAGRRYRSWWYKLRFSLVGVAIATVFVLPTVAEYTVPGDVLYPMKVLVNEEVRSTFARTPYQKVEWEAKLIERRISEAHILAQAGLLTPEVEADVATAVNKHRSNASAEIALLQEENNQEEATLANLTLASVFAVHSEAFKVNNPEDVQFDPTTTNLSVADNKIAEALQGGKEEIALFNGSKLSYPRLMAELEKQTTRAYERLESVKNVLPAQEVVDIKDRFDSINERIMTAQTQTGNNAEANIDELTKALLDIQKLITFMNDINARTTVAVEDIVAIGPTFSDKSSDFILAFEQLKQTFAGLETTIKLQLENEFLDLAISRQIIRDFIDFVDNTTLDEQNIDGLSNKLKTIITMQTSLAEELQVLDLESSLISTTTALTTKNEKLIKDN